MRDLKPQDLQGLSQECAAALAAQILGHVEQQARDLEVKQKLIERKRSANHILAPSMTAC